MKAGPALARPCEGKTMELQTLPAAIRAAAARHAARDAVIDGELRLSYAELVDQAETAARALIALGVQAGERVAICTWPVRCWCRSTRA